MTEQREEYITDALEMIGAGYDSDQPAAIIDPPRNVRALRDSGLIEYKAWGWVKMSAKFIAHLRFLKGAKLAIWQCIALSIDETGTCKMTLKDIGTLTGYSHTEVIASLSELETGGYMTINRDGKTNIYQPVFVARGEEKPKETLVKKLDSTPAYQYESSPSLEKSVPSIKRVKRVNHSIQKLQGIEASIWQDRPTEESDLPIQVRETPALDAFQSALQTPLNWNWYPAKTTDEKTWRDFRAYVVGLFEADKQCFSKYQTWRIQPYARGAMSNLAIKRNPENFPASWSDFLASSSMYGKTDVNIPQYKPLPEDNNVYVPNPNRRTS